MARRENISGDLFAIPTPAPAVEGSMDYRAELSALVSQVLAEAAASGKDRYAVAGDMSRLTGHEISKPMLDGYSSPAREAFNMPLAWVPAFETVCGTVSITNWLAAKRGGQLLVGAEAVHAEIGRLQAIAEMAMRRARELKALSPARVA